MNFGFTFKTRPLWVPPVISCVWFRSLDTSQVPFRTPKAISISILMFFYVITNFNTLRKGPWTGGLGGPCLPLTKGAEPGRVTGRWRRWRLLLARSPAGPRSLALGLPLAGSHFPPRWERLSIVLSPLLVCSIGPPYPCVVFYFTPPARLPREYTPLPLSPGSRPETRVTSGSRRVIVRMGLGLGTSWGLWALLGRRRWRCTPWPEFPSLNPCELEKDILL